MENLRKPVRITNLQKGSVFILVKSEMQLEVEYLGHIVSHEGVKVDPSKTKAIKEWKIPTSIKHV